MSKNTTEYLFKNVSLENLAIFADLTTLSSQEKPMRASPKTIQSTILAIANWALSVILQPVNEQSCIAISQETSDTITKLWGKYRDLILDSIMASTLTDNNTTTNFWIIDGTYYDHQPRLELLKMLYVKGLFSIMSDDKSDPWLVDKYAGYDEKVYSELDDSLLFRKGIRYSSITSLARENGIVTKGEEKGLELGFSSTSEEGNLLRSFYEENGNFIFAFMNAIKEEERKKIECFFNLTIILIVCFCYGFISANYYCS